MTKTFGVRAVLAGLMVLSMAGCFVRSSKNANGDKDVNITTPLGGMSVQTDEANVVSKIGLPVYPGATPHKKDGDNNGSADVDMNFGAFHLRVLAAVYDSADAPAQVETFYRKALSQYSDVIACQGKVPVGTPVKTGLGLTCSDNDHRNTKVKHGDDDSEVELRAGSPSRQHIVAYKPAGAGTVVSLISLDLPRDN